MTTTRAKFAYLLCTCHKFGEAAFAAMTRQYEPSRTLATRHHFSLHINLYEKDNSEEFSVKDVHFVFAESTEMILADALQVSNNQVLSWEMPKMYENLKELAINLNVYQLVSVYTIMALIKRYHSYRFKYIFIPVILDYGRGGGVMHQCALIVDMLGKMIFYEPYGKYVKYGKSYKKTVCSFFKAFDGLGLFGGKDMLPNGLISTTYHNLYNLDNGIQNIILEKNNARKEEFDVEYANAITRLGKMLPDHKFDNAEIDDTDNTASILDLLFNIDRFDGDVDEIINTILSIYYRYNSKTCVTITLVEMNKFFNLTMTGASNRDIHEHIGKFYKRFNINMPNDVLMGELDKLMDVFNNSSDIRDVVKNDTRSVKICKALF
jgi:hypothetical protein